MRAFRLNFIVVLVSLTKVSERRKRKKVIGPEIASVPVMGSRGK